MSNRIIISEKQMKQIQLTEKKRILEEHKRIGKIMNEAFYPKPGMVRRVFDTLNKYFTLDKTFDVDENGYPIEAVSFVMKASNGTPLRTFRKEEVPMFLDSTLHDMIANDEDRRKFFIQAIKDWVAGKGDANILSVNEIS